MLAGERTREYLTPERESRAVCDLCRTRADRAGWIRADRAAEQVPGDESEQRPRERPRWRPRRGTNSPPSPRAPERPERSAPESPERRIRRALDRFNSTEHRRTVEGLTRSLGMPRVAAITPAEAPQQVRLTVAWDLSWYQWKVEFSGEQADVSTLRNGRELAELGAADRAWNARADEDGRLQLGLGSNGGGEPAPDQPE
jgi:hypothetical protein